MKLKLTQLSCIWSAFISYLRQWFISEGWKSYSFVQFDFISQHNRAACSAKKKKYSICFVVFFFWEDFFQCNELQHLLHFDYRSAP